jgi:hypothetical protein
LTIFISEPLSKKLTSWANKTMSDSNKYLNVISHYTREEDYSFDLISDSISEKSITRDIVSILFEAIESAIDTWAINSVFANGLKTVINSSRDIFIGTGDSMKSSNMLKNDLPSTDATASSVSNVETVTNIVTSLVPNKSKNEEKSKTDNATKASPERVTEGRPTAPKQRNDLKDQRPQKDNQQSITTSPNFSGMPTATRPNRNK